MKKFLQTFYLGRELWFILIQHLNILEQIHLFQALLLDDPSLVEIVQQLTQDWVEKEEKKDKNKTMKLFQRILTLVHGLLGDSPDFRCYHEQMIIIDGLTHQLKTIYNHREILKRFNKSLKTQAEHFEVNTPNEAQMNRSYIFASPKILLGCFHFFNFDEEFFSRLEKEVFSESYKEGVKHFCLVYEENVCLRANCRNCRECRKPKWSTVLRDDSGAAHALEFSDKDWWMCGERPGISPKVNVVSYSRLHLLRRLSKPYWGRLHVELYN